MQNGIAVIAGLLVVLILLVAEKQEDRAASLGRMLIFATLGLIIYTFGPLILGLLITLVLATKPAWGPTGRFLGLIWDYGFLAALVAFDVYLAYGFVVQWDRSDTWREKATAIVMALSAISAAVGFVGFCFSDDKISGYLVLAGVLFIVAVSLMPKPLKARSTAQEGSATGDPQ